MPRLADRARNHLLVALLLPWASGCYFISQGLHQLQIISDAQPIPEVLAKDSLAPEEREKLQLVQELKAYAEQGVGMTPTDNFTTYFDPGPRPISYIVSACQKTRFEPHLWHFSIVGALPYKGYFDKDDAAHERDQLEALGLDTSIQPVGAYSTLGYFKDPVLSYHLKYSRSELTSLIIHELAHSTVYSLGHTDFNESMAEFVAKEAGLQFLKSKYGPDSKEVREFLDDLADAQLYESFIEGLYGALDSLYRSGEPEEEILRLREDVFAAARAEFRALKFKRSKREGFDRLKLNNAVILSRRLYMRYPYWQGVFEKAGRSWPRFWAMTRQAAESPRPFAVLDELLRVNPKAE